MLWSCTLELYAVKVSNDGNVAVVSFKNNTDNSYRIAYWKNAKNLSGVPEPTWVSENLRGTVGREVFDVSAYGNTVIATSYVPGIDRRIYLWRNALSKAGYDISVD